jgi:toxin HigB-1
MRVRFADKKLEALYLEGKGAEAYPPRVARAFVKAVDRFQTFESEREFYQFKGWHVEKLSGERKGQYSLRMNKQFRLVYTLEKIKEEKGKGQKEKHARKEKEEVIIITVVVVLELTDYH